MYNPRNNGLITNARSLRKAMTKEERHLWFDFLRYCTPRFRRQEIIGNYIADFYCNKARLVIELDGSQHTEEKALAYDAQRSVYFASLNIQVIRYYNNDILNNFEGVCQDILRTLAQQGLCPTVKFPE